MKLHSFTSIDEFNIAHNSLQPGPVRAAVEAFIAGIAQYAVDAGTQLITMPVLAPEEWHLLQGERRLAERIAKDLDYVLNGPYVDETVQEVGNDDRVDPNEAGLAAMDAMTGMRPRG